MILTLQKTVNNVNYKTLFGYRIGLFFVVVPVLANAFRTCHMIFWQKTNMIHLDCCRSGDVGDCDNGEADIEQQMHTG